MKEIIIVANDMTNGGAERVLSELIREWIHAGIKICIIQTRASGYKDSYDVPDEVEIINIDFKSKIRILRKFVRISRLIHILNSHKDAAVLAMINPVIRMLGFCIPFIKNKIIFSERNDPEQFPRKKFDRFVRDHLFRFADVCVFQTPSARAHFCTSVQRKGIIIPNPVNDKLPEPYGGVRRKAIVAVCRLARQKNIPMSLHAFKKLLADHPDYVLEIYGRGDMEDDLKKLAGSLGIEEKVLFKGFSHNVYEAMNDAAMYVSSSDYEGISNSMLEALGMGIPTVCTDCPCGGARTYIKNEVNGLLVPVGDADALYLAMKKILDDEDFSRRLSENARKIREEFPVHVIAKKWLEVLT